MGNPDKRATFSCVGEGRKKHFQEGVRPKVYFRRNKGVEKGKTLKLYFGERSGRTLMVPFFRVDKTR